MGVIFIAAWSSIVSYVFCFIFREIGRLRVQYFSEVVGFDNLFHTDIRESLKTELGTNKSKDAWCFDPNYVKVSDFKCDSAIPVMNEDTKKELIMTLEFNIRKNSTRREFNRVFIDNE